MRLCRYNRDKLGLVKGDQLIDVTPALEVLPERRWPCPPGDPLIADLDAVRREIAAHEKMGYVQGVANVALRSPVANPTKVIGAPANYRDHVAEARDDPGISFGRETRTIAESGLFLKAVSALAGAGDGIVLGHAGRRKDHEIELALVIGRGGKDIAPGRRARPCRRLRHRPRHHGARRRGPQPPEVRRPPTRCSGRG